MGERLARRVPDVLLVAAVWVFTAVGNGSQAWVSLDTPDSEFHASMAVFANAVTERAAIPVYYWTRLGEIVPAHALTQLLGPLPGLQAYRFLLIGVIVTSVFVMLRRFTDRTTATLLTLLVGANTVLLGYLGNPYPTATMMAGTFAVVAFGVVSKGSLGPLFAGATLGWVVMSSPYGAMLAGVAYLTAVLSRERGPLDLPRKARSFALVAGGGLAAFSALWLAGRRLFPGLDWLSTYVFWNSKLHQADYIHDLMRWTRDPSMLVLALAMVVALVTLVLRWRNTPERQGAFLAITTSAFALLYWWLFPNNYLEIPHYQAALFPAALCGLALMAAGRLPRVSASWTRAVVAAAAVALVILSGHATPTFGLWQAQALALMGALVFLAPWDARWTAGVLAIAVTFSIAQLLQNSRDTFGVSTQRLYANAYAPNETTQMLASAIKAQSWVIERTQPGDRVLVWLDADWDNSDKALLPLAGFQLWGANEAVHGPTPSADDIDRLSQGKPLSIVMYGRTIEPVLTFWNGLPKQWRPSVPECTKVPWPATTTAQVCVTHLEW